MAGEMIRAWMRVLRRMLRQERYLVATTPVADGLPACPWTDLGGEG